jgi:hypothetical protein
MKPVSIGNYGARFLEANRRVDERQTFVALAGAWLIPDRTRVAKSGRLMLQTKAHRAASLNHD